jgi:hypothetical protein
MGWRITEGPAAGLPAIGILLAIAVALIRPSRGG